MASILIVDDDVSIREMLKDLMEVLGHAVVQAQDGMEGLSKIREGKFDLVILDVNMPILSGRELLRLIRREPGLNKIPVLMCTAQSTAGQVDAAFEAGATGYIVKPFDVQKVGETVKKTLALHPQT
jgi:two-component system, chemotaxis family, chemotaxis protein CheY